MPYANYSKYFSIFLCLKKKNTKKYPKTINIKKKSSIQVV